MDFLKYLDILIGLAIVMVLLSPMVTVVTQLILWIGRFRTRLLSTGVKNLVLQLTRPRREFNKVELTIDPVQEVDVTVEGLGTQRTDSGGKASFDITQAAAAALCTFVVAAPARTAVTITLLTGIQGDPGVVLRGKADKEGKVPLAVPWCLGVEFAHQVAESVLKHPMIGRAGFSTLGPWKGSVIEREELIRILLEFAANEGSGAASLEPEVRAALQGLLSANGIPNPAKALADIREKAQEEEKDHPALAAHARQAVAILETAKSPFVGKVNNWFDQSMDRVGERYTLAARVSTAIAALVVAFAIQFDSLDLLKRLSADDKLRASLLAEAQAQQQRIDVLGKTADTPTTQGAAATTQTELDSAKAVRQEIDQNLAKLRAPQLSILPDHFPWQRVPEARLEHNETWAQPYPRSFELVLGTAPYTVAALWTADPLYDVKSAIDRSGAPVKTRIESDHDRDTLIVRSDDPATLKLMADGKADLLTKEEEVARARLVYNPKWQAEFAYGDDNPLRMIVGYDTIPIALKAKRDAVPAEIERAINQKKAGLRVRKEGKDLLLTAEKPDVRWIVLRLKADDPSTTMLTPTEFVPRTGRVSLRRILESKAKSLSLSGVELCKGEACESPDLAQFARTINDAQAGYYAAVRRSDTLVLTSKRLGAVELRWKTGAPETNILNRYVEQVCGDIVQEGQSWRGILLSWLLLSLGAPFWYDALKDLLKLRPSLASKEDQQRVDRQTDTTAQTKK